MSLHFQKDNPGKGSKGFYIALGVCLIAVGVAAWTTYDSVIQYAAPEESSYESRTVEPVQQTVSGATARPTVSSRPESQASVESAASQIPEKQKGQEKQDTPSSQAAESQKSNIPAVQSAPARIDYSYPVGGKVTKNFSGDNPIFSDTMQDWRVHSGTDFSAKNGDAISAIGPGTVTESYKDQLLGNVLVIDHGELTAYYCGLGDTLLVKKGDTVAQNQKIGSVTTIPCESIEVPHLHLEIKKDGEYIDPMSVFEG